MINEMDFDVAPINEACVQAPYKGNHTDAYREAVKYAEMLHKRFANMPYGMRFIVRSRAFDDFYYYVVALKYEDTDYDSIEAMQFIESHMPERWNDSEVYDVWKEIKDGN